MSFCRMSLRRLLTLFLLLIWADSSFVAAAQGLQSQISQRTRSQSLFRRLGILGRNTPLRLCSVNRNVASSATGANPISVQPRATGLTFQFSGFTAAQTANFQTYLQTAYPLMVQLYGEPAPAQSGRIVKVMFDANASDGVYDIPVVGAADGGTIRLAPVDTTFFPTDDPDPTGHARDFNNFLITVLALNAFHGRQLFEYDSWELGFSHAAALIVTFQAKGSPTKFDPAYFSGYVMPLYDTFNRPDLAGKVHYAAGQPINLGFYRNAMAQSVWLKVWVENSNFFKAFNTAYYAQSGDITALRALAAAQLPQGKVEGLPFEIWYNRQFVMDTAVKTGQKLWLGIWPYPNFVSGDTRSVFFAPVERYTTNASGADAAPGTASQGTVSATNELGQNITALSAELNADSRVLFDALGESELNIQDTDIVGFAATSTAVPAPANQSLVNIKVSTGVSEATAYFPYNVAGNESRPNGLFGVVLGTDSGKVKAVSNGAAVGAQVDLKRGAFGIPADYPSGSAVKTTFTITPTGGAAFNVVRNSCWINADPQYLAGLTVVLEAQPVPQLSISDAQSVEGDSGTRNLAFTVSLDAAASTGVTVAYATANGTATSGSDFTNATGTLSFAIGETTKQVLVPIKGDTTVENDETFVVNLSAATNAAITTPQATGTIQDDDAPRTLIVENARSVPEGSASAPGFVTFTINLSGPSGKTVTVNYLTANNTALAGLDYVAKSGTLSFAPGETVKYVRVNFIGDAVAEANETFFLDLKTPTGATIADSRGSAYIRNDDGPGITIENAAAVNEGNSGTRAQSFTVRLAAASTQTVTVSWATANNTAGPADFVAATGTLTFAPGQVTKTIVVQIKGDTVVEPTENYRVNLKNPTFAVLTDSQGVGYIRNDDAAAAQRLFEDEPSH